MMSIRKRAVAISAAVVAVTAGGLATASPALADAYGCHQDVCVNVPGHGDYVGKVTVSLDLSPRQSLTGHFDILVAGHYYLKTKNKYYKNESHFHSHRWSVSHTFDRDFRKGDKVCGKFVVGGHTYDAACETVG